MLLAALVLMAVDSATHDLLSWERDRIVAGEWWRLLTGHLVHGSVGHALMNVTAGAALLVLPDGGAGARHWAMTLLVTALAVGVGLLWSSWPDVYVGLSGVLHGLLAWLACRCAGRSQRGWLVIGVLLWIKIAFEQLLGTDLGTGDIVGMPVAVDSHLLGAAAGTALGLHARRQAQAPASGI